MSRSIDLVQAPTTAEESEISHTRHLMDLLGAANESNHQQQAHRLSLSLGSHVLVPPVHYRQRPLNSEFLSSNYLLSGEEVREACNPGVERMCDDYSYPSSAFAAAPSTSLNRSCSTSYGPDCFINAVANSRYLRPAQSLLEEAVNVVGKGIDLSNAKYIGRLSRSGRKGGLGLASELKAELCGNNGSVSAEKKDVQMEMARLIGLLEEVGVESLYFLVI